MTFFAPGTYASLPKNLLADAEIGPVAKIVYAGLQSFLSGDKNQAWPGAAGLRQRTGLSRRAIQRGIDKLVAARWIEKKSKGGPTGSNLYTLYPQRKECASAQNTPAVAHEPPNPGAQRTPKEGKTTPVKTPTQPVPIPSSLDTPAFRTAWNDWVEYRRQSKKRLTPMTASKQLEFLASEGLEKAVAIIEQSIQKGWQGLFPLKNQSLTQKKGPASDYTRGF